MKTNHTFESAVRQLSLLRAQSRLKSERLGILREAGLYRPPLGPDALMVHATPEQHEALAGVLGVEAYHRILVIDRALHKAEDGTFGRCDVCDGSLSPNRLAATPALVLCSDCATPAPAEMEG